MTTSPLDMTHTEFVRTGRVVEAVWYGEQRFTPLAVVRVAHGTVERVYEQSPAGWQHVHNVTYGRTSGVPSMGSVPDAATVALLDAAVEAGA